MFSISFDGVSGENIVNGEYTCVSCETSLEEGVSIASIKGLYCLTCFEGELNQNLVVDDSKLRFLKSLKKYSETI